MKYFLMAAAGIVLGVLVIWLGERTSLELWERWVLIFGAYIAGRIRAEKQK